MRNRRSSEKLPVPAPGIIVGHAFLWSHEAHAGHAYGRKTRPCVIAGVERQGDNITVRVVPVTHSPPTDPSIAVEIPQNIKRRMKLDSEPSWAICNEINEFRWTRLHLGGVRLDDGSRKIHVGSLYGALFRELKEKVEELDRQGAINITRLEP